MLNRNRICWKHTCNSLAQSEGLITRFIYKRIGCHGRSQGSRWQELLESLVRLPDLKFSPTLSFLILVPSYPRSNDLEDFNLLLQLEQGKATDFQHISNEHNWERSNSPRDNVDASLQKNQDYVVGPTSFRHIQCSVLVSPNFFSLLCFLLLPSHLIHTLWKSHCFRGLSYHLYSENS